MTMSAATRRSLPQAMTLGEAQQIVGAPLNGGNPFGQPSKMPGYSYGLDAFQCQTGNELADVRGSTCEGCYARKNFYATWRPVVKNRQRHQEAVHHTRWVDAMVRCMQHYLREEQYFRWHDSGDLVAPWHLGKIVQVALRTPWLHHWLPTREYEHVRAWVNSGGTIPHNLVVRLSAHMIDRPPELPEDMPLLGQGPGGLGWNTSTVHSPHRDPVQVSELRKHSVRCRADFRDNHCGHCRACWSPKVVNVSYTRH